MKKYLLFMMTFLLVATSFSQVQKYQVGLTSYDLQTNNSITRRVAVDPATGKVVITYTGAPIGEDVAGNFPSRGTGYFYYGGSGSITPITTFPGRIEDERVGWGTPLFLASGKEMVISHCSGSSNGIKYSKRSAVGTGSWAHNKLTNGNETWPRAANSGDSIVIICSSATPGELFGMKAGGIGIKRSIDGGATWLTSSSGLDSIQGLNVGKYPNITLSDGTQACILGGDEYAMDMKGSQIAILTGGLDVTLFTSNDFGNTWTSKVLIDGDNNVFNSSSADTLPIDNRNRGDFSVLIDNSGVTHCFWGNSRGSNVSTLRTGSGIVYWNSSMSSTAAPKPIGKTIYGKESGIHAFPFFPFLTISNFNNSQDFQESYGIANAGHPSSGIDANGTIYLSYSRVRGVSDTNRYKEGKLFDASGLFYTDCYILKSMDGGATWIGPLNVSNSDSTEDAFPSIARHVDPTYAHIMYQEDNLFGHALAGNSAESHKGVVTTNKIMYARVPVSDIIEPNDNMPPVLKFNDNYERTFRVDSLNLNTFSFYAGCKNMLNTGIEYTNIREFVEKYIAEAYDDSTQSNVIVIDTPDGIKMNVAGTYRLIIYAKDAAGKVSQRFSAGTGMRFPLGIAYSSWDTMKLFITIISNDVTPPVLTLSTKQDFVYKGTTYTLPSASVTDDDKCGNPTLTLPLASMVDVNTVGKYKLPYQAKDAANNISRDTLTVYVVECPVPAVSSESIVTTGSKKELYASAKTSASINLFPEYVDKYQWSVKKGTTSTNLGRNKDTIIEVVTTREFDSVCVDITNQWTTSFPLKKAKPKCKALKNTIAIQSINKEVDVMVYPNPNTGTFQILVNGNKSNDARITLTNMEGRVVIDNQVKINNNAIPFQSSLTKGTYFMTMEVDGNVYLEKIEVK